jgi:natural product precursor
MKKLNNLKSLSLNKMTVSQLNNHELNTIIGGKNNRYIPSTPMVCKNVKGAKTK